MQLQLAQLFLFHLAIEQCPPLAAWPEPAAISGGSLRRSTGAETMKSQLKKAARPSQKTACNWCVVLMRPPSKLVMAAHAHTDQRACKSQGHPDPAVQAAGGDAAEHGADVAAKRQARVVAHDESGHQANHPLLGGQRLSVYAWPISGLS